MNYEKQAMLAARLYKSTSENKLDWKPGARDDSFQVSFPTYSLLIYPVATGRGGQPDFVIELINANGDLADSFSDMDIKGIPNPPHGSHWFLTMKETHAMARRYALGADKALDTVINELGPE